MVNLAVRVLITREGYIIRVVMCASGSGVLVPGKCS